MDTENPSFLNSRATLDTSTTPNVVYGSGDGEEPLFVAGGGESASFGGVKKTHDTKSGLFGYENYFELDEKTHHENEDNDDENDNDDNNVHVDDNQEESARENEEKPQSASDDAEIEKNAATSDGSRAMVGKRVFTTLKQLVVADHDREHRSNYGLWWSFLHNQMENDSGNEDDQIFSISPDSFLTCVIFHIKSICQFFKNDDIFNYISLWKILHSLDLEEKNQTQPSEYDVEELEYSPAAPEFDDLQQKIMSHEFSTTREGDIVTRALLLSADSEIKNASLEMSAVSSQVSSSSSTHGDETMSIGGLEYDAKKLVDYVECDKIHFSGTLHDWLFIADIIGSIQEKSADTLVYVNKDQASHLTKACDRLLEIVDIVVALKRGLAVIGVWNNILHFHLSTQWEFSGWLCNLAMLTSGDEQSTSRSLLDIEKITSERAVFSVGACRYQLCSEIYPDIVEFKRGVPTKINECRLVLSEIH